jgi:hypothetical protein
MGFFMEERTKKKNKEYSSLESVKNEAPTRINCRI